MVRIAARFPLLRMAMLVPLASCAGHGGRAAMRAETRPPLDWRAEATSADRERLRGWRDAWIQGLASARAEDAAGVAAQGNLFVPDRALAGAMPPAGRYRCRVFKLGDNGTGTRGFTGYPPFACRLEGGGGTRRFVKLSGSQRPVGRIFPDTPERGVFLGTLMLGDERRPLAYGRDAQRDMAGLVERVGPRRWRLVLPRPRFESILDVIELVPAETP